jgi:hypothetical protein
MVNLTGRMVFSTEDLVLPATIQPDHLSDGLYILKLYTRDGIYAQKLLVR